MPYPPFGERGAAAPAAAPPRVARRANLADRAVRPSGTTLPSGGASSGRDATRATADPTEPPVAAAVAAAPADTLADLRPALEAETIKRAAGLHAQFVRYSLSREHTTSAALLTLSDALHLAGVPARVVPKSCVPLLVGVFEDLSAVYVAPHHLAAHAVLVFSALRPFLAMFPAPVRNALAKNTVLVSYMPLVETLVYPEPPISPWNDSSGFLRWDVDIAEEVPHAFGDEFRARRLTSNLESSWDIFVSFQRSYRGDNAQAAAGVLDREAVCRVVTGLHPAAVDRFAARLLALLAEECLSPQGSRDRLSKLSARMVTSDDASALGRAKRASRGTAITSSGKRSYPHKGTVPVSSTTQGKRKQPGAVGVTLHRIPEIVRDIFSSNSAELFFLDFLDAADSAKLTSALAPRLAQSLRCALAEAAAARTEDVLTKSVLHARLAAKFLAACMHSSNWAHSAFSFSGDATTVEEDARANLLGATVVRLRAPSFSATWKSYLDLTALINQTLASCHAPSVFTAILVADISLRIASVDPVAPSTAWFTTAVESIREVARIASVDDDSDVQWLRSVPVVRCIVEDLFSDLGISHASLATTLPAAAVNVSEEQSGSSVGEAVDLTQPTPRLGSAPLLSSCIFTLDALRQRLESRRSNSTGNVSRPRRIRPTPMIDDFDVDFTYVAGQLSDVFRVDGADGNSARSGDAFSLSKARSRVVIHELWDEFYRRLDGRVRDVVVLVIASNPSSPSDAYFRMHKASSLLLPNVSASVTRVASHYCSYAFGRRKNGTVKAGSLTNCNTISSSKSSSLEKSGVPLNGRNTSRNSRHEARSTCSAGISRQADFEVEPSTVNVVKQVNDLSDVENMEVFLSRVELPTEKDCAEKDSIISGIPIGS